jgi:hypothetical protein
MKHPISISFRKRIIITIVLMLTIMQLKAQIDSIANLPQYLFSNFDTSAVRLKTGESFKAVMNYNTLTEKMTFYQKGTLLDLIKPETIDTICIQDRLFVPIEKSFYEVILNAPIAFFIQHKSDLVSTGRPAALGTTSQTSGITSVSKLVGNENSYNLRLPENFKIKPYEVYWVRMNNGMHKFLNERQLLKIFPAKEAEITEFINQSHLKINKINDLIKLAKFCNELNR